MLHWKRWSLFLHHSDWDEPNGRDRTETRLTHRLRAGASVFHEMPRHPKCASVAILNAGPKIQSCPKSHLQTLVARHNKPLTNTPRGACEERCTHLLNWRSSRRIASGGGPSDRPWNWPFGSIYIPLTNHWYLLHTNWWTNAHNNCIHTTWQLHTNYIPSKCNSGCQINTNYIPGNRPLE